MRTRHTSTGLRCLVPLVLVAAAAPAWAGSLTLVVDAPLWETVAHAVEAAPLDAALHEGDAGPSVSLLAPAFARAASTPAVRGHGPFGIGLQVGAPTALTVKYYLKEDQAFAGGVGAAWDYGGFAVGISLHADYLFELLPLIRNSTLSLEGYLGPGLWLSILNGGYVFPGGFAVLPGFAGFNALGIGLRVPIGLSLQFNAAPIELFLELAPAMFVFPAIGFGVGPALGIRFYF